MWWHSPNTKQKTQVTGGNKEVKLRHCQQKDKFQYNYSQYQKVEWGCPLCEHDSNSNSSWHGLTLIIDYMTQLLWKQRCQTPDSVLPNLYFYGARESKTMARKNREEKAIAESITTWKNKSLTNVVFWMVLKK